MLGVGCGYHITHLTPPSPCKGPGFDKFVFGLQITILRQPRHQIGASKDQVTYHTQLQFLELSHCLLFELPFWFALLDPCRLFLLCHNEYRVSLCSHHPATASLSSTTGTQER